MSYKEQISLPTIDQLISSLPPDQQESYREYGLVQTVRAVKEGRKPEGVHECLTFDGAGKLIVVGATILKSGIDSIQPWDFSTDMSL